jgi:hypothetical protein
MVLRGPARVKKHIASYSKNNKRGSVTKLRTERFRIYNHEATVTKKQKQKNKQNKIKTPFKSSSYLLVLNSTHSVCQVKQ